MKIQNKAMAGEKLAVTPKDIRKVNADGIVEVPDEMGHALIKTPGWTPVGRVARPVEAPKTAEPAEPASAPQEPAEGSETGEGSDESDEGASEAQEGGTPAAESPADLDLPAEVTAKRSRKPGGSRS